MNKKIITSLCIGACGAGLVCTSLIGLSMDVTNDKGADYDAPKPFNRGKNYEKFSISKWFKDELKFDKILKTRIVNQKYEHYFDEEMFKETIKKNTISALEKIDRFKSDINTFQYEVLYKIEKDFIDVDLVWYAGLQHYYDQFRISFF